MKKMIAMLAVVAITSGSAYAIPGTTDTFDVDPLVASSPSVTLAKYSGVPALTKVTVCVDFGFENTTMSLSEPVASFSQTGARNDDADNAEAQLTSSVLADVVGAGAGIDGADATVTTVQTLTTGQHFNFAGEDITGGFDMVFNSPADLAFFSGGGTFTVNFTVTGGWAIAQEGGGGQGSIEATFDTDFGGTVEVKYEVIPEPASMALMGLGGLALIRRRR
jgi:hypothetical protein